MHDYFVCWLALDLTHCDESKVNVVESKYLPVITASLYLECHGVQLFFKFRTEVSPLQHLASPKKDLTCTV